MKRHAIAGFMVAGLAAMSSMAYAQWIHIELPGTPRTKDGKPDLSAPAPRTPDGKPDFTGIWEYRAFTAAGTPVAGTPAATPATARQATAPASAAPAATATPGTPAAPRAGRGGGGAGGIQNLLVPGDQIIMQPWAEALFKQRQASNSVGLPSEHCLPHGPPEGYLIPIPFKILQTPAELAILFEEFNFYRQIFTDGRGFPEYMNPTWYGYSIGKWDKDTLVVDTKGFNDSTWLDIPGHPHSEDMHTIERFTRPDFGHMQIAMTIDDPKAYKQPFTLLLHFTLQPDTELIEHVCDNERDIRHMVGK